MKYKMFVADYDGTLGAAPDRIEKITVDAVNEYTAKGGRFVVCTGRELGSIRNILKKYGIDGDVICCQGAIIADIESGEKSFIGGIDGALSAEIIEYLESVPEIATAMAISDGNLYYDRQSKYTDQYERLTGLTGVLEPNLKEFIGGCNTAQKLMGMCEAKELQRLSEGIACAFGGSVTVNSGFAGLIEIINPDCSKGVSTLALAKRYGIDPCEVLAVGDSTNDLSLMMCGFHGVAVGDGADGLKAAADEVTVSYGQNPVAYLLKKYCL